MCENNVEIMDKETETETKKAGFFGKILEGAKTHAPQIAKAGKVVALGGLCFALGVNVGRSGRNSDDSEEINEDDIVVMNEDDV